VWTIETRTGVTFHNGQPWDAAALKANLDADRASMIEGRSALQMITSTEVVDPTHVRVSLSQPWTTFPVLFDSQAGYMLAPAMLDGSEAGPIGTGPFVFVSRVRDVLWTFHKNPHYWQPGLPHLDEIEFRPIPDEVARLTALQNGDVDVIHTNKPAQVEALKASDFKVVDYDNGEKDMVLLNSEQPPFDHLSARRAVAYATDYERWRQDLNHGVKPKATGPLSPGQPGYEEDTGFPTFDLARARELVQQYEAETGKPLEFEYLARADVENTGDAQALVDMWQQAGMKVTLQTLPQIQLIAHVATGGYQLSEWRLFGNADPLTALTWIRSTAVVPSPGVSLNFPRFRDAQIDADLDQAMAARDTQARGDALRALARRLGEQVPYIWLGRVDWVLAANPKVNGIYAGADGSVQSLGPKPWLASLWIAR
jgi:peptide/nickel transport system substrate-binding protein